MFVKGSIFIYALWVAGNLFSDVPEASKPVAHVLFAAFDVETTGFSPKNDRIIEMGVVKFFGNGNVLAATNWLVNPNRSVPYYATERNGITTEMVAESPAFKEVFPNFVDFCGEAVLIAHHARFDVDFMRAEIKRAGLKFPDNPVADSLALFRKWFPLEESHSLEVLTKSLGVVGETYHRAEADAFHILTLFKIGMTSRSALTLPQLEDDAGGFNGVERKQD